MADDSPRWEVIDKLYNEVDDVITKYIEKESCVFIEVDIALMMIKEKLNQNKTNLYIQFINEEMAKEDRSGMYR